MGRGIQNKQAKNEQMVIRSLGTFVIVWLCAQQTRRFISNQKSFWHAGWVSSAAKAFEAGSEINSDVMLSLVEISLHSNTSEWVFLRELRVGTGRNKQSAQRLDAFALNCYPHLGMKRVCYELKASRGDFFCEVRNPLKRRIGLRYSNEFFFVTPAGLLALEEVPTECGLIEVGRALTEESQRLVRGHSGFFYVDAQSGWYCMVIIPAPWRDTPSPTWQFTASMLRNQQRAMNEKAGPVPKQQKFDFG